MQVCAGIIMEPIASRRYPPQLLYPSAQVLRDDLCTISLYHRTGPIENFEHIIFYAIQSGKVHPFEAMDQSDLVGMGDFERFGCEVISIVYPHCGGLETQRCATVEYGDETLDLQRDLIAEDAEIPEVAVLVGYDEIQSYHPVQTPFHIHAPDVLER